MSLHDKLRCQGCTHPRYEHTGTHVKGSKTACRAHLARGVRCACQRFRTPQPGAAPGEMA